MKSVIVIPARYGSSRLPGKPLAMIAGQTMLQRVVRIAQAATKDMVDTQLLVATDDDRIVEHCKSLNVPVVMTPVSCQNGTERAEMAVRQLSTQPDFILNFQGDAPLTPPDFLAAMIESFRHAPCDIVTPVTKMTWEQLDKLRETKKTTPASGTCAVFDDKSGRAFWFSKNIIPLMRNETDLRKKTPTSPVYLHIGLYGYSRDMLAAYNALPEGHFEALEGLEQLRALENGHYIRCVPVDYRGRASMSGVDSPEDITRAEALIAQHGELVLHAGNAA